MHAHKASQVKQAISVSIIFIANIRSEEHTSELQSQSNLVCRLLLEKKKKKKKTRRSPYPPQPNLYHYIPAQCRPAWHRAHVHPRPPHSPTPSPVTPHSKPRFSYVCNRKTSRYLFSQPLSRA